MDEVDRAALLSVSGERLSSLAGKFWQEDADVGEADALQSGNTIVEASQADLDDYAKLTDGMDAQWFARVDGMDVDAKAALEALRRQVAE